MKKPRNDSILKNLPEERQEQIIAWLKEPKTETCSGGLKHAKEQLAADGIKVSDRALSEFWHWYHLRERYSDARERTEQIIELLKQSDPNLAPGKISAFAQDIFKMQAIQAGDRQGYIDLEYLRLNEETAITKAEFEKQKIAIRTQAEARAAEKLKFEREKWIELSCQKILKAATDEKTREIAERNIPNAEKIALLRKHHFADVDELEKSGSVQIPK